MSTSSSQDLYERANDEDEFYNSNTNSDNSQREIEHQRDLSEEKDEQQGDLLEEEEDEQ